MQITSRFLGSGFSPTIFIAVSSIPVHAFQVASAMSDSATLWTIAHWAPLSMGFSRQDRWDGLLCPPPADLPDPEIEPTSLTPPALEGTSFNTSTTCELCGDGVVTPGY